MLLVTGVSKTYGGLRPLRVRDLTVAAGETVGLSGFDQVMAEVFVNLVTGAALPDEGEVHVFGKRTADITDSGEWLALVDRFGIISRRVVLLDQYTVAQNVAMSLTLDVEPVPADVRSRVEQLGAEAGLGPELLDREVASVDETVRHRVRLARSLALDPQLLLVEHPVAGVEPDALPMLATDLARAVQGRNLSMIVLAAEPAAARPFAARVLALDPATGVLRQPKGGLLARWLGKGDPR